MFNVSYTSRLNRLKQGAGETLTLWGDEFEEQLTPEDLGFVDPSSYSDSGVGSDNNNPRPGTSDEGGLDAIETGGEGGGIGAAVTVGVSDDVLLVEGGGAGAAEGGNAAVTAVDGVPLPHPMDVEEPEWDNQGDCVPLPPWKVPRTFIRVGPNSRACSGW